MSKDTDPYKTYFVPNLFRRFGQQEPVEERTDHHAVVYDALYLAARELCVVVPEGREKDLMLQHLEEAMFWAGAGISRAED